MDNFLFNFGMNDRDFYHFLQMIAFISFLITAVVHLFFAAGVQQSARDLAQERGVHFVPPYVWMLATVLGGIVVATAFWLIHFSTLSAEPRSRPE